MNKKVIVIFGTIILAILVIAIMFPKNSPQQVVSTPSPFPGVVTGNLPSSSTSPNASKAPIIDNTHARYCLDQGGKIQVVGEVGNQTTKCVFADGRECSAADFYKTKSCER